MERFWSKVDRRGPDECWLWTGQLFHSGYGQFRYGPTKVTAHRMSFMLEHGRDPVGYVLHSCDTKRCVNPKHLREGTPQQNMSDMVERGRSLKGELHHKAKVTEEQAKEIIALRGSDTQKNIAERYGISAVQVGFIQTGRSWKHLHQKEK